MLSAALIPSIVVWLAVIAVSFVGLTGFARDTMQWHHWTNLLIPLSLDGISVSFGGWAFVTVRRHRHPGRSYKIVLAAAALSATLNFVHGRSRWSIWAGAYLAFLSVAAMVMFRELLDQFISDTTSGIPIKSRYPRFGQRWLYAPISTMLARRAWIVHPPDDDLKPTIRNALSHMEIVRSTFNKKHSQHAGSVSGPVVVDAVEATPIRRRSDRPGRNTPLGIDGRIASDDLLDTTSSSHASEPGKRLNQEIEQLWLDLAAKGEQMTGPELQETVKKVYGVSRSLRWAANRRNKALQTWTQDAGQIA